MSIIDLKNVDISKLVIVATLLTWFIFIVARLSVISYVGIVEINAKANGVIECPIKLERQV